MASQLLSNSNPTYTLAEGRPIADPTTSLSIRQHGGALLLLQDTQLIETLAHFNRERIPERVVHAKAAGAYGEFEVTHDISHLTSAKFLNGVGKKTPLLQRISTVGPEKGSADTARDPRGWAIKFYTEEGNCDWVFNNTPVFFIRDPIKFPSVNRAHKRHPQTNLPDATMFWDFHNNNQEGIHELMHLFSDRGTPASLRHTDGFSGHTYKLTKEDGSFHYVKIHLKSNQGTRTFTGAEATKIAGTDPDHHVRDLFKSIEKGEFPSWTAYLQVMTPEEAERYRWNVFDMTKDIEQAAFSPSTIVPGFAPSADPILQARLFAYPDASRYRLGVNYQTLPTNAAHVPVYSPYQRDGFMSFRGNYGPDPNYVRSSLRPLAHTVSSTIRNAENVTGNGEESNGVYAEKNGLDGKRHKEWVNGKVQEWKSEVTDEDFVQPRAMWEMFRRTGQQEALVRNVSEHLQSAEKGVRGESINMFKRVNEELGKRIEEAIAALL